MDDQSDPDLAGVDFEAAADLFKDIFPDATLEEIHAYAERGAVQAEQLGHRREAAVLARTASVLRRRLIN